MLSPISLIYLSFDAPCHGGARGTVCFGRRAQIIENVEGYLTPPLAAYVVVWSGPHHHDTTQKSGMPDFSQFFLVDLLAVPV